jgi:hypothetical protein
VEQHQWLVEQCAAFGGTALVVRGTVCNGWWDGISS